MEKRSRRRIRDLVTQAASQGLSENEIGCARISMMARSTNAPFTGRIQKRKTNHLHPSLSACNTRPVHTLGHELPWVMLVSSSLPRCTAGITDGCHDYCKAPRGRPCVRKELIPRARMPIFETACA